MAEEIVAQGGLISDDIMLKVITSRLDHLHNKVSSLCFSCISSKRLNKRPALDPRWFPKNFGSGGAARHPLTARLPLCAGLNKLTNNIRIARGEHH